MSESYNWVNIKKKEYISPSDFGYGDRLIETSWAYNDFLKALFSLLAGRWEGDLVFFMGDEHLIEEDTTIPLLSEMYTQTEQYGYPGDDFGMVCESYRNISCFFKDAEKDVREEIEIYIESIKMNDPFPYNEYGIDIADPYKGLFFQEGKHFRYVINDDKKVYYSPESVKTFYFEKQYDHMDPLPLLMCYGRSHDDGLWLGDMIRVSDEKPDDEYTFLDVIKG